MDAWQLVNFIRLYVLAFKQYVTITIYVDKFGHQFPIFAKNIYRSTFLDFVK